jgi:hypothetical protein
MKVLCPNAVAAQSVTLPKAALFFQGDYFSIDLTVILDT